MESKKKIRIMLVDDHSLIREGFAALLRETEDYEIVGSSGSGEDAINNAASLVPDVILMDIMMWGMTGIEASRWIKEQNPQIKIILVSTEVNKENISNGIKCGVDGFLPKNSDKDTMVEAIRAVLSGQQYFSPSVKALVFEDFYLKEKGLPALRNAKLSKREEEVLILIAQGKSIKLIAEELFISAKTVETHKLHIMDKLALQNTAQLVKYAFENDLIKVNRPKA